MNTVCFRLLAALGEGPSVSTEDLEALATREGLDARAVNAHGRAFVDIAWGDCACSLYTRKDGLARVIAFLDALHDRSFRIQLLLQVDDAELQEGTGDPPRMAIDDLRTGGLAALPEGLVVELTEA
jgi:hypothetical protein